MSDPKSCHHARYKFAGTTVVERKLSGRAAFCGSKSGNTIKHSEGVMY